MRTPDLDEAIDAVTVTDMAEGTPALVPGLIRRAERFMADNAAAPTTVSDVAAHLGISLRSPQAGFRQWRALRRRRATSVARVWSSYAENPSGMRPSGGRG